MNMGVLFYYICQWCYSQNSTLNVVRVVFDLPKTSEIILFQTINYIFEISYRFIEFVSLRAPLMDNILDCNEHKNVEKQQELVISHWNAWFSFNICVKLIINSTLLWNVISQVRLACGMVSWQEGCKPCRQNFP